MKSMAARLRSVLFIFSVLIAFIGCKKGDHHQPEPSAQGSLQDENGNCMPGTIHGTWYNGITTGTDTNYVQIAVNVTRAGYYRIATDLQNGVVFADSGIFASTGLNTVRLKATGSFIGPWATHFTTTFDTTSCQFLVPVLDSTGLSLADNTWQFTAGGHVYRGAATAGIFQTPQGGGATFEFDGTGLSGSPDTTLSMAVGTSEFYFNTGSHPTSVIGNGFYFATATDPKYLYTANHNTAPAVIDVYVTSITTTPDFHALVIGTFNGTVRDTAQNIVPITNARFKVKTYN